MIKNFHVVNKNLLLLKPAHRSQAIPCDNVANVFLVPFSISYASIHLYDIMEILNTSILYHDTDSFELRLINPLLGDYLEIWRMNNHIS